MARTDMQSRIGTSSRLVKSLLALLALLLIAVSGSASQLRVTSWDLSIAAATEQNPADNSMVDAIGAETIESIQKLSPEVIFLQHAPDLEGCIRLAGKLKPVEYQVISCSTLRDAANRTLLNNQVAILAKKKARISWSEAWPVAGSGLENARLGYAFAATTQPSSKSDLNIGLFSISAGGANENEKSAQLKKLMETLNSVQSWNSNRLQSILISGYLEVSDKNARSQETQFFSSLMKMGFRKSLDWLPQPAATDTEGPHSIFYIYTKGVTGVENLVFSPASAGMQKPVTCDVRLDTMVKTTPVQTVPLVRNSLPIFPVTNLADVKNGKTIAPGSNFAPETAKETTLVSNNLTIIPSPNKPSSITDKEKTVPYRFKTETIILIAISLIGLLCVLLLARVLGMAIRTKNITSDIVKTGVSTKKEMPVSLSGNLPTSGNLTEAERLGLVSNLMTWMKQKMIQRLISERQQFAQTQDAATMAVIKIDERLTQVELDMKERNRQYEQRINELLTELAMAQEENRELIRAKIELLKLEMHKSSKMIEQPPTNRRN